MESTKVNHIKITLNKTNSDRNYSTKIELSPLKQDEVALNIDTLDKQAELEFAKQLIKSSNYQDALAIVERLVDRNYGPAQLWLGSIYAVGEYGVTQNMQTALNLWEKAAEGGSILACGHLGRLYMDGRPEVEKNNELAFYWLERGAQLGSTHHDNCAVNHVLANIHENLGSMYSDHVKDIKDSEMAKHYYNSAAFHYTTAARLGDATALTSLGLLHQLSYSTSPTQREERSVLDYVIEKDHASALASFQRSYKISAESRLASIESIYQYGLNVEKGYAETLRWNENRRASRFAKECTAVGDRYRLSNGYSKAKTWYRKAVEHNEPNAIRKLALLNSYERERYYATIFAENENYKEVFEICRSLPKEKSVKAISEIAAMTYRFGNMYQNGLGVEKNLTLAASFYRAAAEGGNLEACNALGYMIQHGIGVARNWKEAVALFKKAAEGGCPSGCNNLAFMYQHGLGIKKDLNQALKWFELAHELNNPYALYSMEMVRKEIQAFECLKQENYEDACYLFDSLVKDGLIEAKLQIGLMYLHFGRNAADTEHAINNIDSVDKNKWKTPEMAFQLGDAYMALYAKCHNKEDVMRALMNYQIASQAGIKEAGRKYSQILIGADGG